MLCLRHGSIEAARSSRRRPGFKTADANLRILLDGVENGEVFLRLCGTSLHDGSGVDSQCAVDVSNGCRRSSAVAPHRRKRLAWRCSCGMDMVIKFKKSTAVICISLSQRRFETDLELPHGIIAHTILHHRYRWRILSSVTFTKLTLDFLSSLTSACFIDIFNHFEATSGNKIWTHFENQWHTTRKLASCRRYPSCAHSSS